MTPKHHLPDEMLAAYAAGVCAEHESLFVASHLTLCAHCRASLAAFDAIGGDTLDDVVPVDIALQPEAVLAAARNSAGAETIEGDATPSGQSCIADLDRAGLPRVLAPYLSEGVRWRFLAPGVQQVALTLRVDGNPVRLVKFRPGYRVPRHTHVGAELTLVVSGAFEDDDGRYDRGDVEVRDDTHQHELRITREAPCVCLFVSDAPPVPMTLLGRLLRPFLS